MLPEQAAEQRISEKTPGFQSLAPRLAFSGLISHGDTTIADKGDGVDPDSEKPVSSRVSIVSGRSKYEDYQVMQGRQRPTRLVMEDALKSGDQSVLEYGSMKLRDLPDKVFTKDYLKRLE